MKTLIVTAGSNRFREYARLMEQHVNAMAAEVEGGIECCDLSDKIPWDKLRMPAHCKFYCWDLVPKSVDRIVWVDADAYLTRALTEAELPTAPFSAVRDYWMLVGPTHTKNKQLTRERLVFRDCTRYFNAGIFVCTRECMPAWKMAREIKDTMFIPHKGDGFMEQDHWNYAVWQKLGHTTADGAGWHEMDYKYNVMHTVAPPPEQEIVIFHVLGLHRRYDVLEACYAKESAR